MDHRISRLDGRMLDNDHFPRLLFLATGFRVTQIIRRSGRLLIEIRWRGVLYREIDKSWCEIIWPGEVPETVRSGAIGLPLHTIFDLGGAAPFLGSEVIDGFEPAWAGWSTTVLRPNWIRFG